MSAETRRLVEATQTLGAAFMAGLVPYATCQRGKRMGPVKAEPCGYSYTLDLESIIWTRGARYPCWRLASRAIKCPRCGGTSVEIAWTAVATPRSRASRDLVQCEYAAKGAR